MQLVRHRIRLAGSLVGVLVCLVALAAPAGAQPDLTSPDRPAVDFATTPMSGPLSALIVPASEAVLEVTGEPTAAEIDVIEAQWRRFTGAFAGYDECLGTLEVRVVARAEDWYSNRNVGPIAAFYRYPPESIVFVEHGKVTADVLLHEFAHHLDISCGLGAGSVGEAFRFAAGMPSGKGWTSGTSWRNVPAEVFAEAVVAFFDEKVAITVGADAVEVIDELSLVPDPDPPVPGLFDAVAAASPLYRIGDVPGAAPARAPRVV
jgi:hypothetical protein